MKKINNTTLGSRRNFIKNSLFATAGLSAYGFFTRANNSEKNSVLRVIAYNVLKCTGYPRENVENKNQIPNLMAQELSKYSPDIINFSESPDESVVKNIARLLKMNYVFIPTAGNWPGAILTHFDISNFENTPIVSGSRSEDLFTRHWGRATIKISNEDSILVHSAHLYPHDNPVSAAIRKREIIEIIKSAEHDLKGNHSLLVIGDINHTPEMEEHSQWMTAGFTDTFIAAGKGDGYTIPVGIPTKRIDYILAHGSISENIIISRALFEGGFKTNPSDPKSFALSDHLPQYAEFKIS